MCVCTRETMRRLVNVWPLVAASISGLLMPFDSEGWQVMEQEESVGSAVIQHHR